MPKPCTTVILTLACSACAADRFGWSDDARQRVPASLTHYRQSFFAAAGKRLVEPIDQATLIDEAIANGVLWLGDHHRHALLHGLHGQLLRQLRDNGARLAFALEAVGTEDQHDVDAFLLGDLDMQQLRRRMLARWSGSWLEDRSLDPAYYRALLIAARAHGEPVVALEPTPRLTLERRDPQIAAAVAQAHERHPDRLLVVVVGQAHLLGDGDVVGKSGQTGVVIGGRPPAWLKRPRRHPGLRHELGCWRTDADVLWFDAMLDG